MKMPSPKPPFNEPGTSSDVGWANRWDNLRVAALCIGVKAYPGAAALSTTVKDAEAMCKEINMLDRCRAATLTDSKSRTDIYEAVRKQFLELLSSNPPEMVIIFYAGHGMEIDRNLFLMPTLAKYDDADDCKETCISHLEVLKWLKTYVDAKAMQLAYAFPRPAVRFLLILDMCRENFGSDSTQCPQVSDPAQHDAPEFWSMCLSTSRGAFASDGDSQHSPFVQELLDPMHGIFASSMPLKRGIENACIRMRQKRIQLPITIAFERIPADFCLDRTTQDFDLCLSSGAAAGGHGSKHTRDWETDMADALEVGSAKIPRLASAVKRDLPGEEREDEEGDSNCSIAHEVVLQGQDGGRGTRPRTGAAAHMESQPAVESSADGSSRRANDIQSNAVVIPAAHAVEDVELRLRVLNKDRQETEVVVQVRVDKVDLSAHIGLLELPEALRGLTAMRELTVKSTALKTLPEWLGELCGLKVLHVGGLSRDILEGCPLQALPASLWVLTGLKTLTLRYCDTLTALPAMLRGALTGLEDLDLSGCIKIKEVPAWVTSLHKLKVPFVEVRLRVMSTAGDESGEMEVVTRVRVDKVDLSAHTGLLALPEALRGLTAMRELTVASTALNTLPEWLGELRGLQVLRVQGTRFGGRCPLQALPLSLGSLSGLKTLDLQLCEVLIALPMSLGSLAGLETLNLGMCVGLTALPSLRTLKSLKTLNLSTCYMLTALPVSLRALTRLTMLDLQFCYALTTLPASLGRLMALKELNLDNCYLLTALPVSLGALTALTVLHLSDCVALHTPPPSIVRTGTGAVLQFLRDLAKGEAPSHLIKVVLLGDQRAGKSSLADSLVLGRPVTRADNDRTVGIEVRRWRLGGQSQLVANIFDAAGQHVYRATHGFFMSPGALFLHVVRCDMPKDAAVASLLEWVEAVQQEAPGAVMGLVWTHIDNFPAILGAKSGWQEGFLHVVGVSEADARFEMQYLHHHGAPCSLKDVHIANVDSESKDMEKEDHGSVANTYANMQGKVVLIDHRKKWDRQTISQSIKTALPLLVCAGALGLIVVLNDYYFEIKRFQTILILDEIRPLFSDVTSIPIIFIRKMHAEALTPNGVVITAFHGHIETGQSEEAADKQAQVSGRVHTEIERQVQTVDKVLRQLEDAFMLDLNALQQTELSSTWARMREHRDEHLAVLDQASICHATDEASKGDHTRQTKIQDMVDALARLKMHHSEMEQMEQQMAAATPGKDRAGLVGQLFKLRQQRVQRPRILCSHAVSSRTGQGLLALRHALGMLMEDTRLFAHVGAKVPLNYSMLERLAHQGRQELHEPLTPLHYRGHGGSAVLNAERRIIGVEAQFATIRSRQYCLVNSKAYYELEILDLCGQRDNHFRCGFASAAFTPHQVDFLIEMVGDDAVSWAVEGLSQIKWNKREQEAYECQWKEGDVIGLACDLQAMQMLVSVNGSFASPNGLVFDLDPHAVLSGLFAAFSCKEGTVGYNLGEAPFKYDPPAADYCTFVQFESDQTSKEHAVVDGFAEGNRADWEQAVTKHVTKRASAKLWAVCGQSCVSLGVLEEAAGEVGMDKAEVHSALVLLHATGSVLHYGTDTRRGSHMLQGTVFMQPQFIIDAIKYVIREPCASDINKEVRALDASIRQNAAHGEALDRFLGTEKKHGSGVLTQQLLTHLWQHLNPRYHTVLLELMKAFKLLRPLGDSNTFLVPAMLPRHTLPDEYVSPKWWCPSKAGAAAVMHVEHVVRPAEMRIMYKVLGGRLPFGFMSELQVRLSQPEKRGDKKLHFAPEAAVVDRITGSVLSAAYKCGGGSTREWVVLSRPLVEHMTEDEPRNVPVAADCICVMGWCELSSQQGATNWRTFQMVMKEIEEMEQDAPGLYLQKQALYVNASGVVSKPFDISPFDRHHKSLDASELLSFEFGEDGKDAEDVDPNLVLPSSDETKLSKPQQPVQQAAGSEGIRHQVDAFFAKKVDDQGIDVHAEGQLMMRQMLNPVNAGSRWDCNVNPQPTLCDLHSSIASCSERNVRVLHLAGHGRKECGFIWNASDDATQSQEFDVDTISLAIGMASGAKGPLECAVLNACATEKMGRLLRTHNVPYVICWKTPVQNETAKALCELFYCALVQDSSGARDYRRAFFAATDALRSSAYTGSSKTKPRDADDVGNSMSLRHSGTTRSVCPQEAESSQVRATIYHDEDVVLFLSNDGDSDPIYLWRERPPLAPPSLIMPSDIVMHALVEAEAGAELIDAGLQALFEQYGLGNLCAEVCKELEVECVMDLAFVKLQYLENLPKYLVNKYSIRQARKGKLEQIIQDVCAQRAHVSVPIALDQSAAVATGAASTHAPASEDSRSRCT